MPPPSAPVNSVSEAIEWLAGEARRIVRASAVPMQDGTLAFPPQVGLGYDAFWLRDCTDTRWKAVQSVSNKELTDACRLFVWHAPDGAAVDCIKFDGTPIFQPGFGTMGQEPSVHGKLRSTRNGAGRRDRF